MKDERRERLQPKGGPGAWYGAELRACDEWLFELDAGALAELDAAIARVQGERPVPERLERSEFSLPSLGPRLERLRHEILHGRGFALIRGLPVERYSPDQAAIACLGLGAHFGRPVPQNGRGDLLGHVTDLGHDPNDPATRIYATRRHQPFHTDSCDVVALLCLRAAWRGGESAIASSVTVHDEMVRTTPELAEVLARPFVFDRKNEIPPGKGPTYEMPVFHHHAGLLSVFYARDFIEAAQMRHPHVPRLSQEQIAALDRFDAVAARADVRLDMRLLPGDLQLLHNHQVVHARTAFEDWPDPARRRHMLRLWLSPEDGRPLPPAFAERYGSLEPARRGGIRMAGVEERVDVLGRRGQRGTVAAVDR